MENTVWTVCNSEHQLLGVFQTKELALDSLKYSFHTCSEVKLIKVSSYEFKISAVRADGSRPLVTFYVNHLVVNSEVIHL